MVDTSCIADCNGIHHNCLVIIDNILGNYAILLRVSFKRGYEVLNQDKVLYLKLKLCFSFLKEHSNQFHCMP